MTKLQQLQRRISVFFGQNIPPFIHLIVFELLMQNHKCIQVSDCDACDIVVSNMQELQMLIQRKIPKITNCSYLGRKLKKYHFFLHGYTQAGCFYKFIPKLHSDRVTLKMASKQGNPRIYELDAEAGKVRREGEFLCISKGLPELLQQIDRSYSYKSSALVTVEDTFQNLYSFAGAPFQITEAPRMGNSLIEQISYLDKPIDINFEDEMKLSYDYVHSRSASIKASKDDIRHDVYDPQHKQSSQNSLLLTKKEAQQFVSVFSKQPKEQKHQTSVKPLIEVITGKKTVNSRQSKLLTPDEQHNINESIKTINSMMKNIQLVIDCLPNTYQDRRELLASKYKAIRRIMVNWVKKMKQ